MTPTPWVDIPIKPNRWPFYYGWMIIACSSVSIIASIPGQTIGVGVFVDFLVDGMHLSADNLSTAYLIGTILSSLTMPFAGRLLDRWGARAMGVFSSMGLGAALGGFAYCNLIAPPGRASWLWAMITICALFFSIRFFGQGCLTLVGRVMLGRWFFYRRGLATSIAGIFTSIAFSGSGAWLLNELVLGLGWRGAYLSLCIGIGVGHALFAWIFFRDNPEQCGLPRDGFNVKPTRRNYDETWEVRDLTVWQALGKVSFWAFNFALAANALLVTAVAFHLTALGAESDLTRHATYAIWLPMPIFSISGSFFCGYLCDRFDQRWALLLMMTTLMLGLTGLLFLPATAGKIGIVVGLGISSGCFGVVSTVVFPHYLGQKHLGALNGVSMFIVVFASALGPKLFSIVQEATGSFDAVLSVSRLAPVCVVLLGIFSAPPEMQPRDPS